jgi:hypothetical protein
MKPLIIGLLCASVASLAFSQTKSADAKHARVIRITNIRTNANGITAGGPGGSGGGHHRSGGSHHRSMVATETVIDAVGSDGKSRSYPVSQSATFFDQSGRAIDRNKIPSGANAHLEFDSSGAITRVILEK